MDGLGQLIMTGIDGTALDPQEGRFIRSCGIGGILLFSRNFEDPAQLSELTSSIRRLGTVAPFIAVDQEGGRVTRFRSPFTEFPPMGAVARLDSPDLFRSIGEITARELIGCGVNVNFAPVCDILRPGADGAIGDRAFGDDGESVCRNTAAFIQGSLAGGVLPCAKHFPGHGDTEVDSHVELPVIKKSLEQLNQTELVPFYHAVQEGIPFVMTAHLLIESIDRELPASLSPATYQILRKKLGFAGLAVTDDMQMGAVADHFGFGEAAVLAISSGADIVEYRDVSQAEEAYRALGRAAASGRLDRRTLEERSTRIEAFKKTALPAPGFPRAVGAENHRLFLSTLMDRLS